MTCYDLVNCATVTISSSQHNKSSMRVPPCTKGVGLTSILNTQLVQRVSSRELAALAGILHPVQGRIEHQILLGLKCDHVHLTCLVSAVKCSQTVEHLGLPMKPTVHADPRQLEYSNLHVCCQGCILQLPAVGCIALSIFVRHHCGRTICRSRCSTRGQCRTRVYSISR